MSVLTAVLSFVVDVSLGVWLGAMAFFSFVAAPRVFAVLDDRAGAVVNDIFPRYYLVGVGLGLVAVAAGLFSGIIAGFDGALLAMLGLGVVAVAVTAYARWLLIPRMEAAGESAFDRYHRHSVVLNGVAMLSVGLALVATHLPA